MSRGNKICSKCSTSNGVRALYCVSCGTGFVIKDVKQPDLVSHNNINTKISPDILQKRQQLATINMIDWQKLKRGELIKVTGGGPVWVNKNGESEPMGYHGIFIIKEVNSDGILACPTKNNKYNGSCYIYMGEDKVMKSGTFMKKHIIKLMKQKVNK